MKWMHILSQFVIQTILIQFVLAIEWIIRCMCCVYVYRMHMWRLRYHCMTPHRPDRQAATAAALAATAVYVISRTIHNNKLSLSDSATAPIIVSMAYGTFYGRPLWYFHLWRVVCACVVRVSPALLALVEPSVKRQGHSWIVPNAFGRSRHVKCKDLVPHCVSFMSGRLSAFA